MNLNIANNDYKEVPAVFGGNSEAKVDINFSIDDYDFVIIKNFIYTFTEIEEIKCFILKASMDGANYINIGSGTTLNGQSQFDVNYFYTKTKFPNNLTWIIGAYDTSNNLTSLKGNIIFNLEAVKIRSIR